MELASSFAESRLTHWLGRFYIQGRGYQRSMVNTEQIAEQSGGQFARRGVSGSRTTPFPGSLRYTNFYPLYNGANDQVDPVLRVQPVQFQRILPRYSLSTSETRDLGVGPMFDEVPSISLLRDEAFGPPERGADAVRIDAAPAGQVPVQNRGNGLEPWKGRQVDLFA
ncbi:MAG: hypothetical protein JSV89_13120 [Spirochaetaceae bacterium]|nr:MAG: hypothetical protein JSV89_13120 [Spirochaetaceae bacterium]